jgi:hypothetical protein
MIAKTAAVVEAANPTLAAMMREKRLPSGFKMASDSLELAVSKGRYGKCLVLVYPAPKPVRDTVQTALHPPGQPLSRPPQSIGVVLFLSARFLRHEDAEYATFLSI